MLIEFILNSKHYASRTWDSAPRIGETVLLNDNTVESGKIWCQVTNVIWADDERAFAPKNGQWAQVICNVIKES